MNPNIVIATLGEFTLTAYGAMGAAFALLSCMLTILASFWKKKELDTGFSLCLATIPAALIGARLMYVLTMWETISDPDVFGGPAFILQLWQGGYTLYGGVLGGMAGVWLYSIFTRQPARPLLDMVSPGAALMLMGLRAAEYFTGQGLGDYLEEESQHFFPLGVMNQYESWQVPVFLYEAVAAFLILLTLLWMIRRGQQAEGTTAGAFILLLGLSQIMLESLREDEFIRFGFVRFNQLMAAATAGTVLFLRLRRESRAYGRDMAYALRMAVFLLGIIMCILIEFALDKSTIPNEILYLIMMLTLVMMGTACFWRSRRTIAS